MSGHGSLQLMAPRSILTLSGYIFQISTERRRASFCAFRPVLKFVKSSLIIGEQIALSTSFYRPIIQQEYRPLRANLYREPTFFHFQYWFAFPNIAPD